jgi:hypothetical protein
VQLFGDTRPLFGFGVDDGVGLRLAPLLFV